MALQSRQIGLDFFIFLIERPEIERHRREFINGRDTTIISGQINSLNVTPASIAAVEAGVRNGFRAVIGEVVWIFLQTIDTCEALERPGRQAVPAQQKTAAAIDGSSR